MAEPRAVGLAQVLVVGALAVTVVLGAAVVTALLPPSIQRLIFGQPVLIAVLVAGTAFVLWRVATRRPPEP